MGEDDSDEYEEDERISLTDFIRMKAVGREHDGEEDSSDQYVEDERIPLADFIRLNNGREQNIDRNILPVEDNGKI